MINKFLKAKHWQLFILTFGVPMIFQFVMMGAIVSYLSSQANPDPAVIFNSMRFTPLLILLFLAPLFGWFWSVGVGLQKKVPENASMSVKKFKLFLLIPIIYIIIIALFFSFTFYGAFEAGSKPDLRLMGGLFAIIVPLHLFSMFCIFYSLYFVAKTIKTVELQRSVEFRDFAGEFLLIWFYFIGIWIIQPRVNKMIE